MGAKRWYLISLVVMCTLAVVGQASIVRAAEDAEEKAEGTSEWAPAVEPKPLSENVGKGLAWLVEMQQANGGWSQGEESPHMSGSTANIRDTANVADTCVATLALLRAGSTPKKGPHAENVRKAIDFIRGEIGSCAEEESLYITKTRGTRVQSKLGPYIDTFLAAMLLAELKDQMPDEKGGELVLAALDTVMDKIERYQKEDGTFDDRGWAPVLSQSMASKAINRAAQSGVDVSDAVRERAEDYARGQFDARTGQFADDGSAGVALYSSSGMLGAMQDADNTNRDLEAQYREDLAHAESDEERKELEVKLARINGTRAALDQAKSAVVKKLEDERFIAGFGSNGGEEFLSYLNIGESLVVDGGDEWQKWDESMTVNLNRIQNADGSWTGHHCITGRTFCTSAALLVLTVDRAPVPVAAKMARR